jgi:hypothetical protein
MRVGQRKRWVIGFHNFQAIFSMQIKRWMYISCICEVVEEMET